jgi:thiamine pyrophosphate-dependent acetolactate synthase large subunit-like protein
MSKLGNSLERRDVVGQLLANRGDLLVVAGLGSSCYDILSIEDSSADFPLWGAMGAASMMGLGLAMAQPGRRVLVITGDGEILMGLGGLGTIANKAPSNLAIVVLDNERYGETGMQKTHTAGPMNLAAVAAGAGFPVTGTIRSNEDLKAAIPTIRQQPGPVLFDIKILANQASDIPSPQDGTMLKQRFREALQV